MAYYDFEANESTNFIIRGKFYDKKKNKILFFNSVADTHYGISADIYFRKGNKHRVYYR